MYIHKYVHNAKFNWWLECAINQLADQPSTHNYNVTASVIAHFINHYRIIQHSRKSEKTQNQLEIHWQKIIFRWVSSHVSEVRSNAIASDFERALSYSLSSTNAADAHTYGMLITYTKRAAKVTRTTKGKYKNQINKNKNNSLANWNWGTVELVERESLCRLAALCSAPVQISFKFWQIKPWFCNLRAPFASQHIIIMIERPIWVEFPRPLFTLRTQKRVSGLSRSFFCFFGLLHRESAIKRD